MSLIILLTTVLLLVVKHASSYTSLSDASLAHLPSIGSDFDIQTGALLAPILRVRIPDTPEIEDVRQHFVGYFRQNLPKWNILFENSTQDTPIKQGVRFSNLIMQRDPPWARPGDVGRLTLVAHYDSKIEPKGFIGATDSAAPCAMLMHVARSIDDALTMKWDHMQKTRSYGRGPAQGVQILFLDGEEAFVDWTDTDSVYGARSLAEAWDSQIHPAMSVYKNDLSSISLFVLLDLLGSADPNIPSYFPTTHEAYKRMARAEYRLRSLGQLKSSPNYAMGGRPKGNPVPEKMWFSDANKPLRGAYWMGGHIEDDHIPFFKRGVEVLHLIPNPFPFVWHTPEDDGEHLDIHTVEDLAQITTAFTAEYLDLEGFMPKSVRQREALLKRSEEMLEEQDDKDVMENVKRDEL